MDEENYLTAELTLQKNGATSSQKVFVCYRCITIHGVDITTEILSLEGNNVG